MPLLESIEASNQDRLTELIPIRHARMSASPFAFYRATASIMAQDLSWLPNTGVLVQAIGDCHLMNFGGFATPERTLIFDVNDFDETLPSSWEWDVKRLATSFVLAARNNGMKEVDAKEMAFMLSKSYRENMIRFSQMNVLDIWYLKFDIETMQKNARNAEVKQFLTNAILKADKSTNQKMFYKITQSVLGKYAISDQPPLVYHPFDIHKAHESILGFLDEYAQTLQPDRRWLFQQFEVVDVALKVVGVGSVGTRCYVALMMNKKKDVLFLQIKEARASALQPYAAPGIYSHNGQRVVEGQRLVQAASDIFLGWSTSASGRHYYFRQLRDKKIAPDPTQFDKTMLRAYARLCGRTLARAHAKTGDPVLISGYMGKSDIMDESISRFAVAYANQTEKDYETFMKAIRKGRMVCSQDPPK
jgi:uncharacterized protein (DUF2252 family)